jgi:hypothetical protein
MSLQTDLEDVVQKVESVLEGVKSAEPSLAEQVFAAVEQVFLNAGYTAPAPAEPAAPVEAQ